MDNKNKHSDHAEQIERRDKRSHRLALLASGAVAAFASHSLYEAAQPPEMDGTQIIRIEPGMTVDGIVNAEVDGGASHTRDVKEYVVKTNPEVFQDGKASLGSEDLGKDIIVPESVE